MKNTNTESQKKVSFHTLSVLRRGRRAHNDQQWIDNLLTRIKRSPLLVYRPTPPLHYLLAPGFKPGTNFKGVYVIFFALSTNTLSNLNWKSLGVTLAATGVIAFCFILLMQKIDKESDTMLKTDIEIPNFLFQEKIEAQEKIEILRKKYEKDYAKLHDGTFNSLTFEFFKSLAMNFSTGSESFTVEKFKQASELTTHFTEQYQEVYTPEFGDSLKKLKNFFEAHRIFFQAFAILNLKDNQLDDAIKYTQLVEAYRLLASLVNDYWYIFSLDIREDLEKLAFGVQRNTGFGTLGGLKQACQELRLQLKLFKPSVRSGGDLFLKYKKAVIYFLSSTFKKSNEDRELQIFKKTRDSKDLNAKEFSRHSVSTENSQQVYVAIPESDRLKKNKELVELLRTWREEDSE